ncbi:arginase family protein [Hymenobacter busanensis]|nr:formimidoylglutamase [Hymenobacter busanensis]QHJ06933.1 hypothetical protein GUY19_06375 [Hymenobacter busanensis]
MPTFLRELIRPAADLPQADVCLVGLPLDHGTVLEGGRAGAVGAPAAIRRELRRYHKTYNLEHNVRLDELRIADAGDIACPTTPYDHAAHHQRIRERVGELLGQYPRVVVLGGSHDGTYSTVRGLFDATGQQPVGGINLDAHADVKHRADLGSGTPYGKLLREGVVAGSRFTEIGLHSNLNTFEDIDFLHQQQATIVPLAHVQQHGMPLFMERALHRAAAPAFVSFDTDAVAQAFAPAVSAPSSDGLTPRQATEAAFLAGKQAGVRLFEVVEFNPVFDRDFMTARLAATIITAFLTGVAAGR